MIAVSKKTSPIFSQVVSDALISQAAQVYLARQRQATAKTKTRSEINRTKKKWFKQKGTGNARHGARTPAIFVGGGTAHGPSGKQNFQLHLPAKMKNHAMLGALALQVNHSFICDELNNLDGKTKAAAKLLEQELAKQQRILLVVDKLSTELYRSVNNLPMVFATTAASLNLLTLLRADLLICTTAGIKALEQRLLHNNQQKVTSTNKTDKVASQTISKKQKTAGKLTVKNKASGEEK